MSVPAAALAALYAAPAAVGHPEATPAAFSAPAAVLGLVGRLLEDPYTPAETLRLEWLAGCGPLDAELTAVAASVLLARCLREDPQDVLGAVRFRAAGGGAR